MNGVALGTISVPEIRVLGAAVNSIDVNEREGEALHLRVYPTGRQWIVESSAGQLVLDVDDPEAQTDDMPWLPVSERIRRFADCFDSDPVQLSLVDDTTVVATAGNVSAAIDLVHPQSPTPEPWELHRSASVVVPLAEFIGLLWSARNMPSGGMGDTKYPAPTMWLQFGAGWLGLHVDWSDFLPSRSTYRMKVTRQDGHTTAAVPHNTLENFLRHVRAYDDTDEELNVTISVGAVHHNGTDRDALCLTADGWRLTLWLVDPLTERWAKDVEKALEDADLKVAQANGDDWLVAIDGPDVRIKLHHGAPDVARVTALLVTHVEETIELLRELGALNAASSGVRYWLEDGVVRSATDVPCTALNTLGGVVREVSRCAANYTPMLAALGAIG